MAFHCSSSVSTSRWSSSAETPSAAVRTIIPWPGGFTSSMMRRRRRRSLSPSRLEMPKALLLGTSTAKRPGRETSCVRRAPLAPIGFLVTWHRIVCPALSTSSIRGCAAEDPALDVIPVVADVAPIEDGVLRDPDVDEGGLHAREHVLDPAPVDVAVDLVGVVGGPGHVVLHQRAPLEHGDLGHAGLDVHAHQVAPDLLALAITARAAATARPLPVALALVAVAVADSSSACRPSSRYHGGARRGHRGRRRPTLGSLRRPTGASRGAAGRPAGAGLVSPICGRWWGVAAGVLAGAAGGLSPPGSPVIGPSWVWLISDSDMRESPPCVVHEARPAACTTTGSVPSPLTESGSNRAPSRSIH